MKFHVRFHAVLRTTCHSGFRQEQPERRRCEVRERIKNSKQASRELDGLRHQKRNRRFQQLLDLANAEDAEAVGDLWREFGFVYQSGGVRP